MGTFLIHCDDHTFNKLIEKRILLAPTMPTLTKKGELLFDEFLQNLANLGD